MDREKPFLRHPLVRAAVDGLMVVVPIGAIVLLVLGILHALRDATAPLAGPFVHPMIIGVFLFIVICLAVGYVVRSAIGRAARQALEAALFEKIPGYRLFKAFAGDGPSAGGDEKPMRPAIVSLDDAQCPALVMDELPDGRLIVFLPGSPTAMSGALQIMAADRVTLLDVPLLPYLKAISSWGLGLATLMESATPEPSNTVGGS